MHPAAAERGCPCKRSLSTELGCGRGGAALVPPRCLPLVSLLRGDLAATSLVGPCLPPKTLPQLFGCKGLQALILGKVSNEARRKKNQKHLSNTPWGRLRRGFARTGVAGYGTYHAEPIGSIPRRLEASIPWSPCCRSTGKLEGSRESSEVQPRPCSPAGAGVPQVQSRSRSLLFIGMAEEAGPLPPPGALPPRPCPQPLPSPPSLPPPREALGVPREHQPLTAGCGLGGTQNPPHRDLIQAGHGLGDTHLGQALGHHPASPSAPL